MKIIGAVLITLFAASVSIAMDTLIVPGERIGPLPINTSLMRGTSILQDIADDVVVSPPDREGDTKVFSQKLLLGFWANKHKIVFTVFSFSSLYKTQEGLGVGSTSGDVMKIYGEPDDVMKECGIWNRGIGFCLGGGGKVDIVVIFGKEEQ